MTAGGPLLTVTLLFALASVILTGIALTAQRAGTRATVVCLAFTGGAAWLFAPVWAAVTLSAMACVPAATLAAVGVERRRAGAGARQVLFDRLLRVCEQPLTLAADVARLRVYAEAAELAARCAPIRLPPPPEDDRHGGEEVWNALAGTWEAVRAAGELHRTGIASRRPYRRACLALARQAGELAELLERDDAAGYLPPRARHEQAPADRAPGLVALARGPEPRDGRRD